MLLWCWWRFDDVLFRFLNRAYCMRSSATPITKFNVERSSIIVRKHSLHVIPRRESMCCRNRFCHRIGLNCLRAQACCIRVNRAFTRKATATSTTGPSIEMVANATRINTTAEFIHKNQAGRMRDNCVTPTNRTHATSSLFSVASQTSTSIDVAW